MEHEAVIDTACWVAATRANSPDWMCNDPWADALAGKEGWALFNMLKRRGVNYGNLSVPYRTLYFDKQLEAFVQDGGKQVVIVAAGMDTRAFRCEFMDETHRVYEIDFANTFDIKRERMDNAQPKSPRVEIPLDLNDKSKSWDKMLVENGFDPEERAFFLVEGITMYLTQDSNVELFEKIGNVSATGSVLCGDFLPMFLLTNKVPGGFSAMIRTFGEDFGSPWVWGANSKRDFRRLLLEPGGFSMEDCRGSPQLTEYAVSVTGRKMSNGTYKLRRNPRFWLWVVFVYIPGIRKGRFPVDLRPGLYTYKAVKNL